MLFTFPSRYWFAIGLTRVFSLAGWSRRFRAGFLVSRVTQDAAVPPDASPTGLSPSMARLSSRSGSRLKCSVAVLQPPPCVATQRVWALPRSLATTGGIISLFSLPAGTKMFQFPAFAPCLAWWPAFSRSGCPIRRWVICTYTRLFAAYHVLLRLSEPRHPPSALFCFPCSLLSLSTSSLRILSVVLPTSLGTCPKGILEPC